MKIFMAGNTIFPKYIAPELFDGGGINEIIPCNLRGWDGIAGTIQKDERGCKSFWRGGESRHWVHEASPVKENAEDSRIDYLKKWKPYILESFFYTDESTEKLLPLFGDFLLDSGAFTFMMGSSGIVDWEEYIERYADFITRNNIKKFFELDIDAVVGYEEVLRYRKKLETLTNRQCIPVWHKNRGVKEFLRMCDEYNYAAIGGVVTKEIPRDQYKFFQQMISEAHKRGCKLHGLGFTNLQWLPKCHFDSVDSTAWTAGNRFGFVYHFDGKTMQKIKCPRGMRLTDSRKVALINYTEWVKFQQYAEKKL